MAGDNLDSEYQDVGKQWGPGSGLALLGDYIAHMPHPTLSLPSYIFPEARSEYMVNAPFVARGIRGQGDQKSKSYGFLSL